eukprot:s2497_g10.t1
MKAQGGRLLGQLCHGAMAGPSEIPEDEAAEFESHIVDAPRNVEGRAEQEAKWAGDYDGRQHWSLREAYLKHRDRLRQAQGDLYRVKMLLDAHFTSQSSCLKDLDLSILERIADFGFSQGPAVGFLANWRRAPKPAAAASDRAGIRFMARKRPLLPFEVAAGDWDCVTVSRFGKSEVAEAFKATEFLALATSGSFAGRGPSPSTERSFELVSESSEVVTGRRPEHRSQIAASFDTCPGRLLDLASRFPGGRNSSCSISAEGRIERAWVAGQWARAVLGGRIGSPNRTPAIELRSRFYAVARCDNLDKPTIFKPSQSYWRAIGSLQSSSSVSQSFPSELEARIYLESAGLVDFEVKP